MAADVLLLHGIWNARWWLWPLARRLRAAGFDVEIFGYSSVLGGPQQALPRLVERLRQRPVAALVGHSLGGLMALEALRQAPDLPVRRVVCLGSPLCGSATARSLLRRRGLQVVLGRSARLLDTGCVPWSGPAEVGMVAGNVPHGIGRWLAGLDKASDGTVALAETRLAGLADHCEVAASHTGLVFSRRAAEQAAAFLRTGHFEPRASSPGRAGRFG